MTVDDETGWAQPRHRGRPLVVVTVAVSGLITILLLLPIPDVPRRWAVLGLLGVLVGLQAVLMLRLRRSGQRPLSPRWMRIVQPAGWMWGFFTAFQYAVPITGYEPAFSSVLGGAFMGLLLALIMWFGDPARAGSRRRHRPVAGTETGSGHGGRS